MGILASRVEFSFSRGGLLMWRGGGEARGGRPRWAPFGSPGAAESLENMRAGGRRSGGEFAPTAWISAFHEFRLWLFDPSILGRAFLCDLVDSQNNLTFGRRVSATAP